MVKKGTWVSLRHVILAPADRAAGIPADTAATPLIMWVSGFLEQDAEIGQEAMVRTKMNRRESGILEEAEPVVKVDYGTFVPEILEIGLCARQILFGGGSDG